MWVLGPGLRSSLRAASAVNHETVSLAPYYTFLMEFVRDIVWHAHLWQIPRVTWSYCHVVVQAARPLPLYPGTAAEPVLALSPHLIYEWEVFCLFGLVFCSLIYFWFYLLLCFFVLFSVLQTQPMVLRKIRSLRKGMRQFYFQTSKPLDFKKKVLQILPVKGTISSFAHLSFPMCD